MQRGYQTGYLLSMLSDGGTALPQAPKPQYPAGGISPLTLRHNSSSHKQQDKSSLVSSLNSYLAHLATTYPVPTPPKQPPPCLVPYPDGNKILNRPLPLAQLRGRRHIPILINAGGFPMLRVKKPQPPLLSKILRDKLATRQRRGDQILELDALRVWAVDEDIWDRDMRMQQQQQQHHHHHHQTSEKVAEGKGEGKYVDTIDELVVMIRGKLEMEERKQRALAQRFWEIVRLETKLVGEEKEARRVEKVGIWIEKMKSMVEGKGGVWVAHRGVEREKTMME